MKLEVGMYVRFDWRKQQTPILIGKITEEHYDELCDYCYSTDLHLVITEDNVIKASYNIIDLIEVGDYVNGYKVSAIYNPNGDEIVNITLIMEYGYETINTYIVDYSINSIVTHEQMEQMSYRIGDKEQ